MHFLLLLRLIVKVRFKRKFKMQENHKKNYQKNFIVSGSNYVLRIRRVVLFS